LGETEKKLAFEVSQLKAELASKDVELDVERQRCHTSEEALLAQIGESEKRKEDALDALREVYEKSNKLEKECEGISSSYMLCFLLSFYFSILRLSDFLLLS
jgi:hypothetical protein